jgi:hypothetical protein
MIFNGKYTVISTSGEHRTFEIRTQPADAKFAPGSRIISMLVGQNNEGDYKGFGFVSDGIKLWKSQNTEFFRKTSDMIWSLLIDGENSKYYKFGIRIEVEKKCLICNRTLTNPKSLETGVGPECGKRM